jgi:class 3 adenylate cyclase
MSGHLQKGNALHLRGDYDEALASYFVSIGYAKRIDDIHGVGAVTIAVANLYSEIGNSANAKTYYDQGIAILRKTEDTISLASALLNAGDEAFNAKNYDTALRYFDESEQLFKKIDYVIGAAYNLGNVGMVYAEQNKDELAEKNINEAIRLLEELEDFYGISVYLTYMSDIYFRQNDFPTALRYAKRSLELATRYKLNNQISDANLKLSDLHEQNGDFVNAYKHYKEHIVYRDMVKNIETVEQMADQRTDFEVSQKQIEIDLSEQKRKNQRILVIATIIALFLIVLLAVGQFRRINFIRKTKQIIEDERDKSDRLLLNILPEETAEELKLNGKVTAKKYDATTVLFTDFKGFTSYSEGLSPEALVETVGFYFSKFDAIIEKHGLEKIKTIGDAYMCAGGLHTNKDNHATAMVSAAFEIADFVEKTKNDLNTNELTFDIRIGINSGPVVAGVVGTKKFAYDIWGDTVNVAARMETMSEPGKVNISETTYELVKDHWNCTYRGEIQVKNRGSMKMYFVHNTPGNAY